MNQRAPTLLNCGSDPADVTRLWAPSWADASSSVPSRPLVRDLHQCPVTRSVRQRHSAAGSQGQPDIYLPPSEISPDRRPRARRGSRPSGWLALEPGVVRAVAALSVDQSGSTPVQTSSGPRLDGREDFRFCHCRQNAFQLVPGARRIGRPGVQTEGLERISQPRKRQNPAMAATPNTRQAASPPTLFTVRLP